MSTFYHLLVLPHSPIAHGKCYIEDEPLPCKCITVSGSACKIPVHHTFLKQLVSHNGNFELSICRNKNHDIELSHIKVKGVALCSISILRLLDMYRHGVNFISEKDNILNYTCDRTYGSIDIVEHGYLFKLLLKHGANIVNVVKSPRHGLFLE